MLRFSHSSVQSMAERERDSYKRWSMFFWPAGMLTQEPRFTLKTRFTVLWPTGLSVKILFIEPWTRLISQINSRAEGTTFPRGSVSFEIKSPLIFLFVPKVHSHQRQTRCTRPHSNFLKAVTRKNTIAFHVCLTHPGLSFKVTPLIDLKSISLIKLRKLFKIFLAKQTLCL